MCLILFSYQPNSTHRLMLAANRDEFYNRPASSAKPWASNPTIIAGQDIQAGGTWLGLTRSGRFAAITNYRSPDAVDGKISRGALVADFLAEDIPAISYLRTIAANKHNYAGFNLLIDDGENFCHYNNIEDCVTTLTPGYYGLSNALLNTDWPKTTSGIEAIKHTTNNADLFNILADKKVAEDNQLPNTGVGIEMERLLAPRFIQSEVYGTRASTIVNIGDELSLYERGFDEQGQTKHDVKFVLANSQ